MNVSNLTFGTSDFYMLSWIIVQRRMNVWLKFKPDLPFLNFLMFDFFINKMSIFLDYVTEEPYITTGKRNLICGFIV